MMQALAALPCTVECGCRHSLAIASSDSEILPVAAASVHSGSTKILSLRNRPSRLLRRFRGYGSGCGCIGRKIELKCNNFFSVRRKGFADFFSVSCSLTWELETPAVSSDSDGKESDLLDDAADLIVVETRETDSGEASENGDSPRIDVRALVLVLQRATTADDVEELLEGKDSLPLRVYSTVISNLGKEKKLQSAMAVFEWLKRRNKEADNPLKPNLFVYNSLLGAMKRAEKSEQVEELMIAMAADGVVPNVVTFNTLMGIYIEQGEEAKALELFKEMETKGVSPSPASYSTVLYAYRRLEDGFGALDLFTETRKRLQRGELCRDTDWDCEFPKLEDFTIRICYQVMRRWLVRSESFATEVIKLVKKMEICGLHLDKENLQKLIWACTRKEHCSVAKELYTRIREMEGEISLSVCNHVIWLMGKAKKWWAALEIYEDLLDKGPKPNNMSYELMVSHFNILLSAARKKGIWRWGVRLINKMEEKGIRPRTREWNAVLVACSKVGETSAAIEMFRRMVENGEKPTVISYGALLSALEKGKLYNEAVQVWEHMIKLGVEPNLYAYTIMASVHACLGNFTLVDAIIREMCMVGIQPTVVTINAIISGCARNNFGTAAYEWFQRMKVENVSPNEVTYETLIEALARDGKPRLAYELHLRALNEGLLLSSKAYDAVILSSQMYGATIDAEALGPRPPDRRKPVQIS